MSYYDCQHKVHKFLLFHNYSKTLYISVEFFKTVCDHPAMSNPEEDVRVTISLPREAAVRLKEVSDMYRRSMSQHGGIIIMDRLGFQVQHLLAAPEVKR